jgi:hypothetical protein
MVPLGGAGIPFMADAVKCSPLMTPATLALTRQMLEWIAARPREYSEVMETWRTSCPRLSIWEDACIDGFIDHEPGTGKIMLSAAGREFLSGTNLPSA